MPDIFGWLRGLVQLALGLDKTTKRLTELTEQVEEMRNDMQEKYQQLSDLLDAQKGAIADEVQEINTAVANLETIIQQISEQAGPAMDALIAKAEENLQAISDIFTPKDQQPTPSPTPSPTPEPGPEGRRRN